MNSINAEEIIIPSEQKEEILHDLTSILKIEHCKIKLLNGSTVSKYLTKKWNELNHLSGGQYSVNKNIRFKTPMLISVLCDYSNLYIIVKGTINLKVYGNNDMPGKLCCT